VLSPAAKSFLARVATKCEEVERQSSVQPV